MRLRFLPFLAAFALAVSAYAYDDSISFTPPNPTGHRSVDAVATGTWRDPCLPGPLATAISGSTITLTLIAPAENPPCPPMTAPYSSTFHLGVLAPGSYTVISQVKDGAATTELARKTLVVRDDESLQILPYAVPVTGGQIGITTLASMQAPVVTIGDMKVTTTATATTLIADAPQHPPGAVDVTLSSNGQSVTAKAALIYYDPAAADPAVFEPILFPLSFEGAGALGSQWTTESFIDGSGSPAYFRDALPCSGCSQSLSTDQVKLTNDGAPYGHVLYGMRATTEGLTFASRIRDTSRQAQTAGTEVPVVRERDFRPWSLRSSTCRRTRGTG